MKKIPVIEVGAQHDGYYDSDKFCLQVVKAARIAAFKYPPERFDVYLYLIKPRLTQHSLLMHLFEPRGRTACDACLLCCEWSTSVNGTAKWSWRNVE